MPIAHQVRSLLPSLRRFSRALTGNLNLGDDTIAAMLERLVADPGSFPSDVPANVALYRLYLDAWSQRRPAALAPDDTGSAVDRKLAALSSPVKQVFLLHAVEGFSVSEVAEIMRMDRSRVSRLIAGGAAEIGRELVSTVMIIEDEPIIAMDLETIMEDLGHEVVGVVRTRRQAVALAAEREPDLILADIELADGRTGIETVNEIVGGKSKPVIFVTAHPSIYLGATVNRPQPVFLLSKPFSPNSVRAAVSQALFFDRRARAAVSAAA